MTRRAEIELLVRVMLAAAELAAVWLTAPWLQARGPGSIVAALLLIVITPAIAASSQPLVRLVLGVVLGAGLPAVALGPTVWLLAAWLAPAALLGLPVGLLLRRALELARRVEPHLPGYLAAVAAVVIAYPVAGGIAWGIYLAVQRLGAPGLSAVVPLASYAAAIGGATWAWPAPGARGPTHA
jgi:hypothetical protein